MKVLEGVPSKLQLSAMLARLARMALPATAFEVNLNPIAAPVH
jgi:hypothetical protein